MTLRYILPTGQERATESLVDPLDRAATTTVAANATATAAAPSTSPSGTADGSSATHDDGPPPFSVVLDHVAPRASKPEAPALRPDVSHAAVLNEGVPTQQRARHVLSNSVPEPAGGGSARGSKTRAHHASRAGTKAAPTGATITDAASQRDVETMRPPAGFAEDDDEPRSVPPSASDIATSIAITMMTTIATSSSRPPPSELSMPSAEAQPAQSVEHGDGALVTAKVQSGPEPREAAGRARRNSDVQRVTRNDAPEDAARAEKEDDARGRLEASETTNSREVTDSSAQYATAGTSVVADGTTLPHGNATQLAPAPLGSFPGATVTGAEATSTGAATASASTTADLAAAAVEVTPGNAVLELTHPDLGRVALRVSVDSHGLEVHASTLNPAALVALRAGENELRRAVASHGVRFRGLHVNLQDAPTESRRHLPRRRKRAVDVEA